MPEVVSVATPELFTVPPVPGSAVEPSMNVTLPVGTVAVPSTVAVNVTDAPDDMGLENAVMVVVVLALLTSCETAADKLGLLIVSPLYCPVMECVPALRMNTGDTVEPLTRVENPRGDPASSNVTVLVAVVGVTFAVKVTLVPYVTAAPGTTVVVVGEVPALSIVSVRTADVLGAFFESPT